MDAPPTVSDEVMEIEVGSIAAGGGCVGRAPDGRVVFVRHSLPGERVRARITSRTASFLRADALEILDPSPDRVAPACPHAGPGRCGGCDFQHVELAAQRHLKEDLVAEQLKRVAGVTIRVVVEDVGRAPGGLGWRTRVTFAVDRNGTVGLHRHRSHDIVPVSSCPIASDGVNAANVATVRWPGARRLEVSASPDGGRPVVLVDSGKLRSDRLPGIPAGLVSKGRTLRDPDHVEYAVLGHRFAVHAGVFWQVHPAASDVLTRAVLDGLDPRPGEQAVDLYAGAGLFTVALAQAVGPTGSVVAVERSRPAVADLTNNCAEFNWVESRRADVTAALVSGRIGRPDIVVLDPARAGAGLEVMAALCALDPAPRRIVYVSCEPAPFARDLGAALANRWSLESLRAFDVFPMTEHVELVAVLGPPRS